MFTGILDCFFLTRPVVLIPVWGFAAFGYCRGRNPSLAELPRLWASMPLSVFWWILVFSCSVACVYVLNQMADRAIDAENDGMPLLARGVVSLPAAAIVAIVAALLSIIPALAAGHPAVAALSAGAIAVGALYSFRPTYFSGRMFLDFLTNALGFGIMAFAVGWHCAGRSFHDPSFLCAALPYFLLMCGGSISSTIPDIASDRAGGKLTTAVALGPKRAHAMAAFFIIAAAGASLATKDGAALCCSAASLPLYALQLLSPSKTFQEGTYKIGGALCMIAAALIMPVLFIAGTAVFLATWFYFRFRHHVSYPSLIPAEKRTAGGKGTAGA